MYFTLLLSLLLNVTPPPIRCVAIAPHFEGEASVATLNGMVDEIRALGANTLMVVVQWGQANVRATAIAPYQWGTNDAKVHAVITHARKHGMQVLMFPILKLTTMGPGEWRGTLAPKVWEDWWVSYRRFILHFADLAKKSGATHFSVGSELGSTETARGRWLSLIKAVRARFSGKLLYSANWDHFTHVTFWDALDYIGLNAYHPITRRDDAPVSELTSAWRFVRDRLLSWRHLAGKQPLLFTELGYPSVDGGARRPYHFSGDSPRDLEEQRRAYEAFITTWQGQPELAGACVWIWTGRGGVKDRGYMLRGKPSEDLVRRWFKGKAIGH